jgi:dTDP-4-amino-4,6-dideoxygalactose transaminase
MVQFPIHHTFGPLVTREQWQEAFQIQFQPWQWQEGPQRELLRKELERRFGREAFLFATGREALLAALQALELRSGEEVLLQAFTCIVVPNAIHAAQGVPLYIDCDPETLNIDTKKVQGAITHRTRALLCQHTFGIPADTEHLRAICSKRGLALIEDCAHVIPERAEVARGVGEHGDLLILSFGRDKAISGVSGGAVLTHHEFLKRRLREMERRAEQLSHWQILHLIGYPLRYQFAKWIWPQSAHAHMRASLPKAYLRWVRFLGLLPPVYQPQEKRGHASVRLHALPNACAAMALEQWHCLPRFNEHRRRLAELYLSAAKERGWVVPDGTAHAVALLKFPLYLPSPDAVCASLQREQVYLSDGWSGAVIVPKDCDREAAGYGKGSCPRAEEVARYLLTLPTHPTMTEEQAQYLIHALAVHLSPFHRAPFLL